MHLSHLDKEMWKASSQWGYFQILYSHSHCGSYTYRIRTRRYGRPVHSEVTFRSSIHTLSVAHAHIAFGQDVEGQFTVRLFSDPLFTLSLWLMHISHLDKEIWKASSQWGYFQNLYSHSHCGSCTYHIWTRRYGRPVHSEVTFRSSIHTLTVSHAHIAFGLGDVEGQFTVRLLSDPLFTLSLWLMHISHLDKEMWKASSQWGYFQILYSHSHCGSCTYHIWTRRCGRPVHSEVTFRTRIHHQDSASQQSQWVTVLGIAHLKPHKMERMLCLVRQLQLYLHDTRELKGEAYASLPTLETSCPRHSPESHLQMDCRGGQDGVSFQWPGYSGISHGSRVEGVCFITALQLPYCLGRRFVCSVLEVIWCVPKELSTRFGTYCWCHGYVRLSSQAQHICRL